MTAVMEPAAGVLAPAIARLADREQLMDAALESARAAAGHMAAGEPLDPDPEYRPKHRRTRRA